MVYQHPLAFLLGLEGVALLRATAGDEGLGRGFVEARIAEVKALLSEGAGLGDGVEAGGIGTVEGYRAWSQSYDDPGNPLIDAEEPVVRAILAGLWPGRAVDVACGTGRHAAYLAALGHQVAGVDNSPDMLAIARQRVPPARFVLGDLRELPFADRSADIVVCSLALTHQPALESALAEFTRVLRPGGHLVTSDIHVLSLYLGGVARISLPGGGLALLPASRYVASDYLTAALSLGLQPLGCAEPRWLPSPHAGGPLARRWCPGAADAAYAATPAAIIWHFERRQPEPPDLRPGPSPRRHPETGISGDA